MEQKCMKYDESDVVETESEQEEEEEEDEEDNDSYEWNAKSDADIDFEQSDTENAPNEDEREEKSTSTTETRKVLTQRKVQSLRANYARRGVVYISRIPPYMKPAKVKHLLGRFGDISRIFLTPEDSSAARQRRKSGGTTAKRFKDGWVEFVDKNKAKMATAVLNNSVIGGRKRSFYHDDIWNIRYLTGVKWHHLTEKIAAARAARLSMLREEMSMANKDARAYRRAADQARAIRSMAERRDRKRTAEADGVDGSGDASNVSSCVSSEGHDRSLRRARSHPIHQRSLLH